MHRGQIITEGTQKELAAFHSEHDLEELFFRLISLHSDRPLATGLLTTIATNPPSAANASHA